MADLYYRCPSCRTVLANKQLPYEQAMLKIRNNTKMSRKQKDAAQKKLLDDLYLDKDENICCRTRILTYMPQIDIII